MAGGNIGVKVNVTANTKQMKKEMDRLVAKNKKLSQSNKSLGSSFKNLTSTLSPLRLGLAGVATASVALFNSQRKAIDEIGKMSTSMGVSVETLQKWEHTAKLTGTTLQTFTKGQRILAGAIFDANRGLKNYQDAFSAVGLSWQNLAALSPEEQMNAVADALAGMEDKSKRTALAQDLLGRAGTQLLVAFGDVEGTLAATNDELAKSAILNEDQVRAVEDFNDALTNLSASIRGAMLQAFAEVQPHVKSLYYWIKDNLNVIIGALVGLIISKLIPAITALTVKMIALATATTAATGGLNLLAPALVAVGAASGTAYQHNDKFRSVVDTTAMVIRKVVIPAYKDFASLIINTLVGAFKTLTSFLTGGFSKGMKSLSEAWGNMWSGMSIVGLEVSISLISTFQNMANGIINIFGTMWNSIANVFSSGISKIANMLPESIMGVKIPGVAELKRAAASAGGAITVGKLDMDFTGPLREQLASKKFQQSLSRMGGGAPWGLLGGGRGDGTSGKRGRPMEGFLDPNRTNILDYWLNRSEGGGGRSPLANLPVTDTTGGGGGGGDDTDPMAEMDRMRALEYKRGVLSPQDYVAYLQGRMAQVGGSWTVKGSRFYDMIQSVYDDMARADKERQDEADKLRKEQEKSERELTRKRREEQQAEREEKMRLEDLRYEFGDVSPEEHLEVLQQRLRGAGGRYTEEGARIFREIQRVIEAIRRRDEEGKEDLSVRIKLDDKPDIIKRAERGPVATQPRGAC